MTNLYCSMIHSGLVLELRGKNATAYHCCIPETRFPIDIKTSFWKDSRFIPLREQNKQTIWANGCENCQLLDSSEQG